MGDEFALRSRASVKDHGTQGSEGAGRAGTAAAFSPEPHLDVQRLLQRAGAAAGGECCVARVQVRRRRRCRPMSTQQRRHRAQLAHVTESLLEATTPATLSASQKPPAGPATVALTVALASAVASSQEPKASIADQLQRCYDRSRPCVVQNSEEVRVGARPNPLSTDGGYAYERTFPLQLSTLKCTTVRQLR